MKNLKKLGKDMKKSHMYKLKGLLVAMKIVAWVSKNIPWDLTRVKLQTLL